MEAERATYFNAGPEVASDRSDRWLGWKKACVSLQSLMEVCTGQQGTELGNGYKGIQVLPIRKENPDFQQNKG